jgi:putative FmdB family regulatory protein
MPTYAYRCSACATEFELFQRFIEEPLTDCPTCGGTVKRIIHPVGVVFKGSGWYITDSRKSNGVETSTSEKPKKDSDSETKSTPKESTPTPA